MIAHYEDWSIGNHPVSTGEAPWLPRPYREAMHVIRSAFASERAAQREREDAKRGRR